jgi:hypothetical protein
MARRFDNDEIHGARFGPPPNQCRKTRGEENPASTSRLTRTQLGIPDSTPPEIALILAFGAYQLVVFPDRAGPRVDMDHNGMVGMSHRHGLRTLSRYHPAHHYLVDGLVLYHARDWATQWRESI